MSQKIQQAASRTREPDATGKSSGPGKIILAVYVIFCLSCGARALFQLFFKFDEAPVSFALSGLSAVIYIAATVALFRRGLRAYWAAVVAISIELVGVLAVGFFSVHNPELFPKASVWSHFGAGYGYVPLVLPVIGLVWLWTRRPSRTLAA